MTDGEGRVAIWTDGACSGNPGPGGWQRLDEATKRHQIAWHWVKGHAGDPMNERADELARRGMKPFKTR